MRSLSVFLAFTASACSGADDRPPNVLLISIDTLRPDHLSCYGYGRQTSPAIDRLAQRGVLFENHISSSSWTLPAHAALFTSVSDTVHGCVEATGTALSPEFTTLAERFQAAGYATGGFYAGPYLHAAFGLGQGFDTYEYRGAHAETLNKESASDWAMDLTVMRASHHGVTNPGVYDATRDWLAGAQDEPFFAFVHLWDVHFDFTPPEPYDTLFDPGYEGEVTGENFFFDPSIHAGMPARDREHLVALYDGEIRWTDTFVEKLVALLEDSGIADDTIIAVTSDHGTEFFEHGHKAHRTTLFDEQIRIPLVLTYPGKLPAGRRVAAQTRITDLGPTLLELAGLPAAEGVMGESLMSLVTLDGAGADRVAVSELFSVGHALRSVRTRDSKLVDDLAADAKVWFDLEADAREMRPSSDLSGGRGAAARARYEGVVRELAVHRERRPGDPVTPELSEAVRSELDAFGYTGGEDEGEDDR